MTNKLLLAALAVLALSVNAFGQFSGGCVGGSGGGAPTYSASGPTTGASGDASTNFTVTIGTSTFSGTETFTIGDGGQGGTITPSVGSPGTGTVVVTPTVSDTSFTFTYTPASTGAKVLTFTNGQQWTNPVALTYTSTGAGACTEATNFIGRTSGLSGTESGAYTTLICGLVSDGTFSILDGLYVAATNSLATFHLNLISASYNLTEHGTCFFQSDSHIYNNANCSEDTGFNPSTAGGNFSLNAASMGTCIISYFSTAAATAMGNYDGSKYNYLSFSTNAVTYDINESAFTNATTTAAGSYIAIRTASNAKSVYYNGTSIGTASTASTSAVNSNIYLMDYNNNGTPAGQNSLQYHAYFFFGGALTPTQITNVRNRLATFIGTVGSPGC